MMECSCVFDAGINDCAEILSDKTVKSKSIHICHECGKKIIPGEQYRMESTVYEGEFETYKTCLDCNSIREWLVCSFYYGKILDDIRNEIYDGMTISEDCLSELTPNARGTICLMIEKRWETEEY